MSLVLPFHAWPAVDRKMWAALRKEAGPLDDPGGLAHLRQTSCDTLQARYGRWLKWVSVTEPEALALQPAERATLARLQSWLEALAHTKPMSQLMFADGVLRILREAAPEQDWAMQRRLLAGLKNVAGRGDPARKNGRVLSSSVLLNAGLRHAGAHASAADTPLERLKRQRDGTMMALLAVLPMRRRAFAN